MRPQLPGRVLRQGRTRPLRLLFVLMVGAVLALSSAAGWRTSAVSTGADRSGSLQEGASAEGIMAVCATPQFKERGRPNVGDFPYSVAVGDFNHDGNQDLAAVAYNVPDIYIRRGDGMGGFPGLNTISAGGSHPTSIVVGDFNNDGNQDLAVVVLGGVKIRLGNGTGAFYAANTVGAVNSEVRSVAVGDFNKDGKQDIAAANFNTDNVTILLGDGAGGFSAASSSMVGAGDGPVSVAIGDFNHDLKQDLAVANYGSHDVTIRLGDGAGGFPDASASTVGGGGAPQYVAVGDFNNDNNQDLAVADLGSDVTVRLGDGTGGFPTASTVDAGSSCTSVAIGDFNDDGNQDLAVANYGDDSTTIRLGDGTGAFPDASATTINTGDASISVAVGDFNLDDRQDLAVANANDDNVTILLNSCNVQTDLSVTKTDQADPLMVGQQIGYQVMIKNNGHHDATGVVLTNPMPPGTTFVSATSSVGSCAQAGGMVTCTIGNLSNGATATVNIAVKSGGSPGTITNRTSVTANEADSNPSNNQDVEATRLVGLRRFSFSQPVVTGGCQDSVGTLLFTSPAPAGVTIKFPDNLAAIAPIGQVTTVGGETSIQVTAATSNVTAEQLGTVTATTTAGPNSIQARLKLLPLKISLLNFSENPVGGGEHIAGTVTLECAPDRNLVVRLTSNKAAARPDVSTVTIPAGQTSAQFGITTLPVPSSRDVIITAIVNGGYQRAILHLTP